MKLTAGLFKKVNLATIIAVYVLILAGSVVRSTGSGMGCPDWPKCFGGYAPPLTVEALPENYKDIFLEERLRKNERLASMLERLGMDEMANKILNDPSVKVEEDFSPSKAWIEYINRLIGALIGVFILANAVASFGLRKQSKGVVVLSILSLILVLWIGWTGSLVVSTNLLPGFITFHMAFVFLLLAMLIYSNYMIDGSSASLPRSLKTLIVSLFVLFIPQLLLGTQVRETIDAMMLDGIPRMEWMDRVDFKFYFHRSYSILLLIVSIAIVIKSKVVRDAKLRNLSKAALGLMVISATSGAIMYYFSVPATFQPLHLVIATMLFGILFYLLLLTIRKEAKIS